MVYGHVGARLITLDFMLRIPVNMHNVADEKVFCPKVGQHLEQKEKKPQIMRHVDVMDLSISKK